MRFSFHTVAATLLAASVLVACDSAPDPDDAGREADGTAAALVEGLARGDLDQVAFDEGSGNEATTSYAETIAGMDGLVPDVELGDVAEDGATATATLAWSWPVTDDEPWTYNSQVVLVRTDDEWRVVWGPGVVEPSLQVASVLDLTAVAGPRGAITGAGGATLVAPRPVVRFGIDRSQVVPQRAGASARSLAEIVGIDVEAYVTRVERAGPRAFVEAITYRTSDVPAPVARASEAVPGIRLVSGRVPLAPTREFAAPILGTVGEVTAEMIADDPDRYVQDDQAGLSGLQARYDDQLQGRSGAVVNAVASDGRERALFRVAATRGTPLALTLDPGLQIEAERLLADVGPASALVALRPSDGALLVAANGPGNDGQNLATFGQYAPGSTFKSVSSLALLRAGLTPDSPVECTPTVSVDGKVFENYDDHPSDGLGQIPFRAAVASSCNTAFIAQRDRLGSRDLARAAGSLGLGIDHDLGFPAYFGSVEPPTTETGRASDMIGQGTILASPMAMAAVIASVQDGEVVVPRLVEQVEVSPPEGIAPLRAGEATALKSLLREVVTSGSGRLLADVPGAKVIAKTGTAEYQRADGSIGLHAWMIAAQGDLAVAVFVNDGESGSGTAGPVLEAFLRAAA